MNICDAIKRTFDRELPDVVVEVIEFKDSVLKILLECPHANKLKCATASAVELLFQLTGNKPKHTTKNDCCEFIVDLSKSDE